MEGPYGVAATAKTIARTMPKDYIVGLQASATSATVVTVAAGQCRDVSDGFDIVLSGTSTANITRPEDCDFTESASIWYYVHVIADSTGARPTRAFLSTRGGTTATKPTLPGGYDKYRRVGAVRNDASSDLLVGSMIGNGPSRCFVYKTRQIMLSGASVQTAEQTLSLAAAVSPTSTLVLLGLYIDGTGGTNALQAYGASGGVSEPYGAVWAVGGQNSAIAYNGFAMNTTASQQVCWKNGVGTACINTIGVMGYYDDL